MIFLLFNQWSQKTEQSLSFFWFAWFDWVVGCLVCVGFWTFWTITGCVLIELMLWAGVIYGLTVVFVGLTYTFLASTFLTSLAYSCPKTLKQSLNNWINYIVVFQIADLFFGDVVDSMVLFVVEDWIFSPLLNNFSLEHFLVVSQFQSIFHINILIALGNVSFDYLNCEIEGISNQILRLYVLLVLVVLRREIDCACFICRNQSDL